MQFYWYIISQKLSYDMRLHENKNSDSRANLIIDQAESKTTEKELWKELG